MIETRAAADDDRGRLSSLARLWPFARPYRGLLALSFTGTLLVTRAVVDGPIARGDRAGLVPLLPCARLRHR